MDASVHRFEMECESQTSRVSPPKSIIDSSPLQPAMDKNKESLKVKLLVRRTLNQLVEQGIMPSLKTSPAIYEQQRQLERAKTGDLLKAKIKQRPDRMELERRHILEHQEGNIDPSLAEKKRMLEKALLVDHLNSKISHRPGPLELIEKNILHADEPIERIVKEGLVNYTSTDEAVSPGQALLSPESMICIEDDSLSSEGETQNLQKIQPINVLFLTQQQSTIATDTLVTTSPMGITTSRALDPPSSNDCPAFIRQENCIKLPIPDHGLISVMESNKKTASSSSILLKNDAKEKIKKKNKNKAISKARSIKFHEYKGPPNAHKHSSIQQNSGETNYQLIMKQQYLLEYLEEICKHPPVLPASSKMSFSATAKEKDLSSSLKGNEPNSLQRLPLDPFTEILNKLKVFQLKRYCKKYNLPVSGSKSSLVDRLKPYLHLMEKSPDFEGKSEAEVSGNSSTPDLKSNEGIEENLLKEQQKRIAELQRQLKKSQEELEQIKLNQMRSQQEFITQDQCQSAVVPMEPKSEPGIADGFGSEEINITSLHTNKILSDMDIKITVRIDPDITETKIKPKPEPDYASNDMLLNVMIPQDGRLDVNDNCRQSWKSNDLLEAVVNDENILPCDSSHKMVSFVSNNETLDKLLGQVQPGIPNLNDKPEHSYTNSVDTSSCSQNNNLTNDANTKSLEDSSMHAPLELNDYNDVDLLDFHMHIDDTCDTGYSITKSVDNSFPSMEVKQPECSSDNLNKLNFESEMLTDSNSSICDDRMEDKNNIFNDFDGLRFVHNEPYCDMLSMQRNGINTGIPGGISDSKMFSKIANMNDINKNYSNSTVVTPSCSLSSPQKHLENFSSPGASNVKRAWMSSDIYYETNKFKPIAPDSLQQNVQLNHNRTELMNIADNRSSVDRFNFDESGKNSSTVLNNSCNNNTHAGQVSPMDFDSLLSNIDLPITVQNCDRGMLDGSQDKILYDLQQNSLLDYFNDDYGMQNDSLTCEINNSSY